MTKAGVSRSLWRKPMREEKREGTASKRGMDGGLDQGRRWARGERRKDADDEDQMRHIQPDERIKSCKTKLGFCGVKQKKKKTEEKAEWIKMEGTGDKKVT